MSPGSVSCSASALRVVPGSVVLLPTVALAACHIPPFTEVEAPDVTYASVAAGDYHVCGLTDSGDIYCWDTADPRPNLLPAPVRFKSVSTIARHACALSEDGAAYCWGVNDVGQLGTTADLPECQTSNTTVATPCSTTPVAVEIGMSLESISVGAAHSCALDADGKAYCWGLNLRGQLGAASESRCVSDLLTEGIPCSKTPVPVAGDLSFASLSAGYSHTCGVTPGGIAYCWGAGSNGRLGTGSVEDVSEPSIVAGDTRFSSLSAGGSHTCGLSDEGYAHCWGANAGSQLGSKASDPECGIQLSSCVATPHPISSDLQFRSLTASGTMFRAIGVIGGHTCGIAIDGEVYCWGLNEYGQLGAHWDLTSSEPVELSVDGSFAVIDAGKMNTCGVTRRGDLRCWPLGTPMDWWRDFDSS